MLINQQGDANYAWLEINVRVTLTHRIRKETYKINCVFQFKIRTSGMAMSQWLLQDIQ